MEKLAQKQEETRTAIAEQEDAMVRLFRERVSAVLSFYLDTPQTHARTHMYTNINTSAGQTLSGAAVCGGEQDQENQARGREEGQQWGRRSSAGVAG